MGGDVVFREGPNKQVFGVPIHELALDRQVPVILRVLVDKLAEFGGDSAEGIFRIPGNKIEVEAIKASLNKGVVSFDTDDVHVVGSLLKLWFRELPEPLVPQSLGKECNDVSSLAKKDRSRAALKLLDKVPDPNRTTCKFLLRFLQKVARNFDATKMGAKNLAVVFAPSLLPKDEDDDDDGKPEEGLKRVDSIQRMSQMSMNVDQNLAFVIELIENLPEEKEKEEKGEEEGWLGWLFGLMCVRKRDKPSGDLL